MAAGLQLHSGGPLVLQLARHPLSNACKALLSNRGCAGCSSLRYHGTVRHRQIWRAGQTSDEALMEVGIQGSDFGASAVRLFDNLSTWPLLQEEASAVERAQQRGGKPYSSDNIWDYKPPWCQPWSVLGTGTGSILLANQTRSTVFTCIVAGGICLWWLLFLVVVPQQFKEYVQGQDLS